MVHARVRPVMMQSSPEDAPQAEMPRYRCGGAPMAIGNLWHPERYQGARRRYPYFEGWYFKLVDASERHRYAVIPGVFTWPTLAASQAFVQFLDGSTGADRAIHSPSFMPVLRDSLNPGGPNRFSRDEIVLALVAWFPCQEAGLLGSTPCRGVGTRLASWDELFVPFMQCHHGNVSLDHVLEGEPPQRHACIFRWAGIHERTGVAPSSAWSGFRAIISILHTPA